MLISFCAIDDDCYEMSIETDTESGTMITTVEMNLSAARQLHSAMHIEMADMLEED